MASAACNFFLTGRIVGSSFANKRIFVHEANRAAAWAAKLRETSSSEASRRKEHLLRGCEERDSERRERKRKRQGPGYGEESAAAEACKRHGRTKLLGRRKPTHPHPHRRAAASPDAIHASSGTSSEPWLRERLHATS